ncbi:MAG: hypothetical protein R3A12_06330 [Ignavibacteria bacterium]
MSAHVGEGNGYATFAELDKYVRSIMKGENVLNAQSIKLMQNSVQIRIRPMRSDVFILMILAMDITAA